MSVPIAWAKLSANFHSNRRARGAGRLGREVFVFVLCQNAARNAPGSIPAEEVEDWYVADILQMSREEARAGVDAAIAAGLIARVGPSIVICGWDDEWAKRPLTETERKHRQRGKESRTDRDVSRSVRDTSRTDRDATPTTRDASRPESDCHVGEERREEEIREEERDQNDTTRAPACDPPVPTAVPTVRNQRAARLAAFAWNLAAVTHGRIRLAHDFDAIPWTLSPRSSLPGWVACVERCGELVDEYDDDGAKAVVERRIAFADAEARAKNTLEFFVPLRMWHAKSFEIGTTSTPRKPSTGRSEPLPPSAYPDGEVQL